MENEPPSLSRLKNVPKKYLDQKKTKNRNLDATKDRTTIGLNNTKNCRTVNQHSRTQLGLQITAAPTHLHFLTEIHITRFWQNMVPETRLGSGTKCCTEFAEYTWKVKMEWKAASTSTVNPDERERVYCRFCCLYAHYEQDGFVASRIGNSPGVSTSHDCDHGVDRHN